jgi:hypothetical protein
MSLRFGHWEVIATDPAGNFTCRCTCGAVMVVERGELDESSACGSSVTTVITYVITEDGPDGQPWLPDSTDFWAIVRRTHGFTRWRRIGLQQKQSITVALGGGLANQAAPQTKRRN